MKYRHEVKHEINMADMFTVRQRVNAVMKKDGNAPDGKYFIRSLYFDTSADTALREKIDGVNKREKFRLRMYNMDASFIRLERKMKENGLTAKQSCVITRKEAEKLIAGDYWDEENEERELMKLFLKKARTTGLKARTIVDYDREAFCYPAGNVRITLDYNIRTGMNATDFLNEDVLTVPASDGNIVLEVKWDEFLPEFIAHAVALNSRRPGAFSKYAACRIYG